MVTPEDVIAVLNEAGVRFVLMGTHGISGWSERTASDRRCGRAGAKDGSSQGSPSASGGVSRAGSR